MEVIGCLGTECDRHGRHKHSDPCFEIRRLSDCGTAVSDLLSGEMIKAPGCDFVDAPTILLQRKATIFRRMVKLYRDREELNQDRSSDAQHAHRLMREVDGYAMVDPTIMLRQAVPQAADELSRDVRALQLFDEVAPRLITFRRASTTCRPSESAQVDQFFAAYISEFGAEHLRRV